MVFHMSQASLPDLLQKTAWPMTPPAPWSAFHIIFSLAGLTFAGFLAKLLSDHCKSRDVQSQPECRFPGSDTAHGPFRQTAGISCPAGVSVHSHACLILWICGLILGASEVYKQLFIYEVVNQGRYDWWYFPFQLCSTPMYLCLAFPLLPAGLPRKTAASFLESFGLLGGVMALAEPSGLMHPYWTLTLHGLLWHILLVFIAFFCAGSGLAGRTTRDFLCTIPLFFVFCLIATAINVFTGGKADMFYISPYYPITQVVFHQISLALGVVPGIAIYLMSTCAGAFLCYRMLNINTAHKH